jgi:hypothetical protein
VNPDTDTNPDPIQGFDDQKLKGKNTSENFFISVFDQKLQFTSLGLQKRRPSYCTGDAFSPQKRTSSTSKNEIY